MPTRAPSPSASTAEPATGDGEGDSSSSGRLIAVVIDRASLAAAGPTFERECEAALGDLLAENLFVPAGTDGGSFQLRLSLADRKLVFDVSDAGGEPVVRHILSLTPLRRVLKDYDLICDAYETAAREAAHARLEAIDMGRRGLHDEAATILAERLSRKIRLDHATARRLFTLVAALQRKG